MVRLDAAALFDPEQVARARSYHRPLYTIALIRLALDLLVLALAAFGPLGRWLLDPLDGWPWWAQAAGLAALIDALTTALGLPFAVWTGFLRERDWGFSTQRLPGFAADRAKAFVLAAAMSAIAMVALVGSARSVPRAWPLVIGLAGAVLLVALAFLGPLLFEPLFNRFAPVADAELASGLGALARRAQLPIKEVLVADASRRTHKANAYVSGLGATRRLVLYDTLLARATRPELGLVLAHELGHRRARHLLKGLLLGMAALAGLVAVLWALLRWPDLRTAAGAPGGARDPRVVPFVLLLAATLQLLGAPFGSALSRCWEREADRFSLELTGDLDAFESVHRSLAEANLADIDPPRPIYLALFTHPTPAERISAARRLARRDTAGSGSATAPMPRRRGNRAP